MRNKTYIVVCAVAALGLSLTSPEAASAFPAAAGTGKAYTQTVSGTASTPVRWGGHGGWVVAVALLFAAAAGVPVALDMAAVSAGAAVGAAPVGVEATEDGVVMAGDGRSGSGSA